MHDPAPLPDPFGSGPFLVGEALDVGIGRGRLAGRDLARPFHGTRSPHGTDLTRAYAPLLRVGDRFSHSTAAELWGIPLPRRLEGLIHVTAPPGAGRPRTAGVIGHRCDMDAGIPRRGLLVSNPVATFLELAPLLDHPWLVAVADHLMLDPRILDPDDVRPYATIDSLRQAALDAHGRGARRARAAAEAARPGVESPMETRLRLLLLAAGLSEPLCSYELHDPGGRIGWFDLAWPDTRVIAEYDGDQHRTSTQQYERDIQRFDRAAAAGWTVVRVRREGLLATPADTVARVRRAFHSRT